jgi:uncharacterized protein (DUF433 family)
LDFLPAAVATETSSPAAGSISVPTLVGTGVRVEIVVERYRAGESPAELAADYRVPVELIDDAVRSELREAS